MALRPGQRFCSPATKAGSEFSNGEVLSMRKLAVAFLFLLFASTSLNAQYFGRNKVQWEHFDFKVLKTEHFDIYYYDREADVVNDCGPRGERCCPRPWRTFTHVFVRKPIVLYAN